MEHFTLRLVTSISYTNQILKVVNGIDMITEYSVVVSMPLVELLSYFRNYFLTP